MNWIKNLFTTKTKNQYNNGRTYFLDEVLTDEQIDRAFFYYTKRKDFIHNIIKETDKSYEPSQPEDKNDPSIWKPEYWKWFLSM